MALLCPTYENGFQNQDEKRDVRYRNSAGSLFRTLSLLHVKRKRIIVEKALLLDRSKYKGREKPRDMNVL